MRNFLLILILLLANTSAEAQNYIPFPTKDAKWHRVGNYETKNYTWSPRGTSTETSYYTAENIYQTISDTIINNLEYTVVGGQELRYLYKRVLKSWDGTETEYNYSPGSYEKLNTRFFIREDSAKKLFVIDPAWYEGSEMLYFDFNAKPKEAFYYLDSLYYLQVTTTDSVLIDNIYRKRFNVNRENKNNNGQTTFGKFIEGIGYIGGNSGKEFVGKFTMDKGELKCFTVGGKTIYQPDPNFNCDAFTIGIKPAVKNDINFSIFPNPTNGNFTIQTQSIFSESYIYVRDVLGRIVHHEKLQSPNQTIDISNHPKGLYFVEVRNGNKNSVQKLILQ